MWNFGEFFTSTEFVSQFAAIIAALFSAFATGFVNALFGIG